MSTRPFVHLHCHSHYSLLDGASTIDRLIAKARAEGMSALALTDHGNLHGALEFYRKAKAADLNPIIGYEAYIAPASRFDREVDAATGESSYHLTLLAQNRTGFRNLVKMASSAYLEGFYRKPRIDKPLLEAHHEGIICLSGCVSGEFSRAMLRAGHVEAKLDEAIEIAQWFHKLFGDRYFIEIQNNGLDIQQLALEGAVEVANRVGLPLVATSDAHYVNREDAEAQDIMLCINTGRFRTDTNRMKMTGDQFHLRGAEEMYAAFPNLEDAVARSQEIADGVDVRLELGQRHFPIFTPPDNKTSPDYLRELCEASLRRRYANVPGRLAGGELSTEVQDRLDRELDVINKLGFANYFLIVWDFVRFAAENNIPAGARGSGVGSIVAYALKMSHVCPLEYDLLFERFLDESRQEAPDIDIDFCQARRGEVIDYVKREYGSENVAQIGTFGTLRARAAVRDVGRALGMPIPRVDAIVAMVPDELNITLSAALEKSDDLRGAYENDSDVREVLDLALKIEGLARNVGTHAAAVVIGDRPLIEYVPLCRVKDKEEVITQWSMNDVEAAGLLKMDFLGLRNLTILAKAVDLIEQTTGERVNPYDFPLDDQPTFDLLCRGETKGIFQLESGGIRDLLQRMKPDHFRDIIATNALYRPGPLEGGMVDEYIKVKHGLKAPEYKHDVMRDVLGETHGVMVYQEQVMRILNQLGGIALPSAYTCIKAISKKKLPMIAKFRDEFVEESVVKGLSHKDAIEMFEMIEKFAGYGFNKSHSTAYALIAYMTAYLKAHHSVEFMAALLSGDIPGRNFKRKDSLVEHLDDCRRMEVEVVPPNVNQSDGDFAVVDGKICFGMAAIKGVGMAAGVCIAKARRADGPYTSLFDFCERVDPAVVNRTAIESLVKAGAFDAFGAARAALAASVDRAIQAGAAVHADRRSGQKGLFDDVDDDSSAATHNLAVVPEWNERTMLAGEREVLGFYLSSHPLSEHENVLRTHCTHTTTQAAALPAGTEVIVGGMISALKLTNTKNPKPGATHTKYAMFDLEDTSGMIRSIIWPRDFAENESLITPDAVVAVRGSVDKRPGSEEANLICNEVMTLEMLEKRFTRGVWIRIDEQSHDADMLSQLKEILRGYPGNCDLQLAIHLKSGARVHCVCEGMKVSLTAEMRERVDGLLGPGHLRSISSAASRPAPRGGRRRGGRTERSGQPA